MFNKKSISLVIILSAMLIAMSGCNSTTTIDSTQSIPETQNKTASSITSSISSVETSENSEDEDSSVTSDISVTESTFNKMIDLTKDDCIEGSFGGYKTYKYDGVELTTEDCEWIENSLNKNGSVEPAAIYRKMAMCLEGFSMGNNWESYAPYILGHSPASKEEFAQYVDELSSFIIVDDNPSSSIIQKFKNIESVDVIDAEDTTFITINDTEETAKEMNISEKMLGHVLCPLKEAGAEIVFFEDKCTIVYKDYSKKSDTSISEETEGTKPKGSITFRVNGEVVSSSEQIKQLEEANQAIETAKDYLKYMSFSRRGLIEQLEYEGYPTEDAIYAVDSCNVDWNEQAVKTARTYLEYMSFSRRGLIEQLEYEGFTHEQAVYGVEQNGYSLDGSTNVSSSTSSNTNTSNTTSGTQKQDTNHTSGYTHEDNSYSKESEEFVKIFKESFNNGDALTSLDFWYLVDGDMYKFIDEAAGNDYGYAYFAFDYTKKIVPNDTTDGFTTMRDIKLLDSIDAVLERYGYKEVKTYDYQNDTLYSTLKDIDDSNYKQLENCDQYLLYTYEDTAQIMFLFNSDSKLVFTVFIYGIAYVD